MKPIPEIVASAALIALALIPSAAAAQELRVAAWNIGAAERAAPAVADSVSGLLARVGEVDILILEEIIDEAQVQAAAEAAGLDHWVVSDFSAPAAVTRNSFASLEVAVLSRRPIVAVAEWDTTGRQPTGDGFAPRASSEGVPTEEIAIDVPFGPERPARGFLRADLAGGLSVYAVHWKSSRGQSCNAADLEFARQREDQATGLAQDASQMLDMGGSVIVGGDFNIQAPGRVPRVGCDPLMDCAPEGSCEGVFGPDAADGYDDSISILLGGLEGARLLSQDLPETFVAASFPGGAIDHLLVAGPAAAGSSEATTPEVEGDEFAGSDHRPVVAVLAAPSPPPVPAR